MLFTTLVAVAYDVDQRSCRYYVHSQGTESRDSGAIFELS